MKFLKATPWDAIQFGMDTYEITELSKSSLQYASRTPAHYTVKIDPLESKQLLHEYGFYYCDTLLEPFCEQKNFKPYDHPEVTICAAHHPQYLVDTCNNAFQHGRFHRDFLIKREWAESRYIAWMKELFKKNQIYELQYQNQYVGFIAFNEYQLVLHALNKIIRGKGLAKYFWSKVCRELFEKGFHEITSSISATNLPVLNLYVALGFRFRNPVDIYHRLTFET